LPASPGFYQGQSSFDSLIDFVVARILDQLGMEQTLLKPYEP
jgi:4-hydroxy-3-polyprenylbenzoate decarboxylase